MGVYNFKKDLIEGHKAEEEVLVIVKKKYPKAHRKEGYFKGFDIYVPEVDKKIEVKFDKRVEESGNYFIETESNSKESGLLTTQADFWVIVDHEVIIFIAVESLRYILRDYTVVTLPSSIHKDSTGGKGYLIPKSTLIFNPYVSIISKGVNRG